MKNNKFYTSWDDLPIVMDLPMASVIVGLNQEYLRKLCKQGKFPAWKLGEQWRVNKCDLIAWIEGRKRA